MPRILENKYYVDEIYDAAIINPILVGSREGLWKLFDVGVIDGFLHAIGDLVKETGRLVRHLRQGLYVAMRRSSCWAPWLSSVSLLIRHLCIWDSFTRFMQQHF